jgi:hypothetical protein
MDKKSPQHPRAGVEGKAGFSRESLLVAIAALGRRRAALLLMTPDTADMKGVLGRAHLLATRRLVLRIQMALRAFLDFVSRSSGQALLLVMAGVAGDLVIRSVLLMLEDDGGLFGLAS